MLRTPVILLAMLAWYAAVTLVVWLCYRSGEWFVAGVIALLGTGLTRVRLDA